MKQDNGKKSKKWLLIVIAIVALLAAAAVALVFILGGNNQGTQQGEEPTDQTPVSAVYWNLDKAQNVDPETGLSAREKGEDGLYTIRFASEGKIVEMKTADKQLVNYIDTMDAVGLVLDESGLIIDVLSVKDVAIENAKNFYVKRVDGNTITVNSSIAMNGMDIIVVLTDAASVMDVRPGSENLGASITLDVFDMVSVYSNKDEVVTSVFLHERPESSPLYIRADRFYNSTTASTTREPDKDGVYTIKFGVGGKLVELKCKDKNIVTGIDSGTDAKEVMGLTFDEEGYITGTITAATAARGKIVCTVYNVTAINGNQIEATRLMSGSEQGKVVNFNLTESTEIVMNEIGCNHFIGEYVDGLQLYDRILVWGDMDNNALYVKIDRRKVEGDDVAMYYLQNRLYDSAKGETSRVPNASGYYVYEMAAKGKMVTVKTKDKKLANLIDANTWQFFGLKVQGGIIKEYYDANCISGGYGIGGQRFVTEVMANIVRIVSGGDFNSGGNYMLTDKTEIYNMTGYNGKLGSKTTLQIGDRVIANRDVENNITHIYVLDRPASGSTKMYYNKSRSYNGTTFETSRTPDAEGYYVFTMYCEGQEVEVKTKDKAIATIIDQQNAPIAALKVNKEGIVTAAYPAIAGKKYAAKVFNYNYVGEITKDKVVSCYYYSNGVKTAASASYPMAKNCKIYNVSTNYNDHRGEKATLKVGDQIQALRDIETGELTHIWIMNRAIDSPLYFHVARKSISNGVTTRQPNADGYYEVELFADGQIKTFRTKDVEVMTAVDTFGSETFFALKTDGDIILGSGSSSSSKKGASQLVSFRDVTKISGSNITVTRYRPGGTDHMQQTEFKINSKTKVYDVCYYSDTQFKEVKLQKGDRISVFADRDGNVNYIFVMYTHTREKGYLAKCSHCNKTVWWEPYLGSFIQADNVHYYYPTNYTRGQGSVGVDLNSKPGTERFTAVFDLNGKTLTSTGRNFLVYFDLVVIDSVGGGVLEARGYNGGSGGNFMVLGGSVEINDGVTLRMWDDPNSRSGAGGNFYVSNHSTKDEDGKITKTYTGKVTINDAKLEGWPNSSGNFMMNNGTVLNLNGGTVTGGNIELINEAKFNWKGGTIESNLTINGGTLALEGTPNFSGMLMTTNGGKVDISKLSTDARIKAMPTGIFTTESDNIDAYLDVFVPATDSINIVKEGKALSAAMNIPSITDDLEFVPGTQMAVCALCEQMVTWTPITQAAYGEKNFGTPASGQHIYLAEDITYAGQSAQFMNAPSRDTTTNTPYSACLHLNGHNWTGLYNQFIHGSYGILNVFGNGVVSGNGHNGATITINTDKFLGYVNLISGTYTKPATNKTGVLQINANGGAIHVGKDAIITAEAGSLAAKVGSANLIPSRLVIAGTVTGDIEMAAANASKGFENTFLMMDGANVDGTIKLGNTNIIGIQGQVKATNLDLSSGAKIAVSELTEGSEIVVSANGIFTEAWENLDEQKGYYAPALFHSAIEVKEGALSTTKDSNAPTLVPAPAVPAKPALLQVDNADLVFEEGTTNAACPVCGEVVEWIAITDATETVNLEGEKHYYLAEDITFEGTGMTAAIMYEIYGQKVTCLHLNGHNITATNAWAIFSGGYLNVMGNGNVVGNGTSQHRGATMDVNSTAARLNLYGGTYTRNASNANPIINVHGNGGIVNMFEGVTVDARNTTGAAAAVRSWCGEFNMYGGAVYGGDSATACLQASNWTVRADGTGSGTVNVYGGLVQAGSKSAITGGGANGAPAHMGIYGGEIRGGSTFSANTEFILAGNPVMTLLNIPTNKTGAYNGVLVLGQLTEGASINVNGDGVFTTQTENAEQYLQYFKVKDSGKTVVCENYALKVVSGGSTEPDQPQQPQIPADPKVPALPSKLSVDNSNLVLDGNNQAKCPVCDKVVTWTAISDSTVSTNLVGDTHYYLANDITYEGTEYAIQYQYNGAYKDMTTCLHLNGHNITATNTIAIFNGMKLNIMGNGIVTGNKNANDRAVTLEVNSTAAVLNIYGGTYKRLDPANQKDMVRMNSAGGIINIYQGAILGDPVRVEGTRGNTVCMVNGTVNVYGGELHGEYNGSVVLLGTASSNNTYYSGTLNVFGGAITAKNGYGISHYGTANKHTAINIYGGKVRGNTVTNGYCDMIVGGTADMNLLTINDAKITLAEMANGATIAVKATGIFTNPSNNINTYKQYFKGAPGYKTPTVVDNALFTEQGTDPVNPNPEQPEQPTKFDNSNLVFTSGNKAMCPVCQKEVEWTPLTQEANGTAPVAHPSVTGMHYYLAEDIVYTGAGAFFDNIGSSKTLCVHLNGHNWTGTQGIFLFGYGSKSRVMGNGIVASGKNAAKNGGITWNTSTKTNVDIQLYGGTYTVTPENTLGSAISINTNGGDITIHEGVKVIGSATAPAVYVGGSAMRTSVLNIKGAEIVGSLKIENCKDKATYATTVVIEDTKISAVELGKDVSFTLKGDTVIDKLNVTEGAKITVGELGADASINVKGNGVISEANTAMMTYFGNFISTFGCKLSVQDNALVSRDLSKLDNSNLQFAEGTTNAQCPYCLKTVEWTAIKSTDTALAPAAASAHYYLPEDVTVNAAGNGKDGFLTVMYGNNVWQNANVCVHLNGHNLTVNGHRAFMVAPGTLNIMGNGIISGDNSGGATIHVNGANGSGTANLFGGTFVKAAANTKGAIVYIGANGGTINMYPAVTIDGTGMASESTAGCVRIIGNATNEKAVATFNMYGGTIQNGVTSNSGGNVSIVNPTQTAGSYAFVNMYDGTISGGKAEKGHGGNLFAEGLGTDSKSCITILGGTVTGGTAKFGGNIGTLRASLVLKNVTVSNGATVGEAAHGGNISVMYAPLTIEKGTKIINGNAAGGQGGNVRAYRASITMNGGEIYGGNAIASAYNHNVWIHGESGDSIYMLMNGGTVKATEGTTKYGTGIHVSGTAQLYLAGNASVVDAENATVAGVWIQGNAKLNLVDGWSGTANVKFSSKYEAAAAIPATVAQIVKLADNMQATAGGTISGVINQLNEGTLAIVPQADGSLKIAG